MTRFSSGILGHMEAIDAVIYFVEQFPETRVILDPIMGDHGSYYQNFDETYATALRRLLPYADIILPNLTECFLLTGRPYQITGDHRNVLTLCKETGNIRRKRYGDHQRSKGRLSERDRSL